MDNRLAPLLTRGESLSRAEYRVLAHLTEHPLLVGNITVRALAQATYVSTATIIRLCQKLGFSGFSEFIWHCKQLLADTPHLAEQHHDVSPAAGIAGEEHDAVRRLFEDVARPGLAAEHRAEPAGRAAALRLDAQDCLVA